MSKSAGFTVTCTCGHNADFDLFTSTPILGDLPRGHYQCPKCHRAWEMQAQGAGKTYASGLYIPPDVKAVPVPARL